MIIASLTACGARTSLAVDELPVASTCGEDKPSCVRAGRAGENPCGPLESVEPTCEGLRWRCPAASREAARTTPQASCLPFHDGPVRALGGSLVRVPTDDGRCLWIAESVETETTTPNVAFEVDQTAPFGTCPSRATFASGRPESIVERHFEFDGDDPSLHVQITGGYRLGGSSRVTYRLFRDDPNGGFGVTELGTGIARFENGKIAVRRQIHFGVDLDLGDASFVENGRAYVWGCPGPVALLTERCVVGRLDANETMELFAGNGLWVASRRGTDGATVFDAGPWISAVVRRQSGLLHVYAVGFGSDLQTHVASTPEGPWSPGPTLGRCALPEADGKAFCAGPVVHQELADPTRNQLVVSYGVGTTDPAARARAAPDAYWPRLVWLP